MEDKNREQLLQIEDLASAAENLSSMATKNNQLLEKVDSSLSTISDQCKKVSKRTSKIKKNGKEVLSVTTSAPTMDVNASYMVEVQLLSFPITDQRYIIRNKPFQQIKRHVILDT